MSWEHLNFWLNLTTLGVLPISYVIWRGVTKMRENDLKHLDERFDAVLEGQRRLELRLDEHVQWHMSHEGR